MVELDALANNQSLAGRVVMSDLAIVRLYAATTGAWAPDRPAAPLTRPFSPR